MKFLTVYHADIFIIALTISFSEYVPRNEGYSSFHSRSICIKPVETEKENN